jgi:hypothetical protein
MARFDVAFELPWAQRSGDGVSARSAVNVLGFDEAAESGRGYGRKSDAFALSTLWEPMGDDGKLFANWVLERGIAGGKVGEAAGESLAVMYEPEPCPVARGEARGVCGRRKTYASGELGAELGVSGRLGIRRVE